MDKNAYKEKLKQFNSTPKYKSEVDFLLRLMQPKQDEKILDYGCGLGNLVHRINSEFKANCFGYDVNNYREIDDEYLFKSNYFFKFDKVYMNHSIAHVPEIYNNLIYLKTLLKPEAKIYVITPNSDYLATLDNANYVPDPTVINHRSLLGWEGVFKECGFTVLNSGQFGKTTVDKQLNSDINERLFIEAQWNGR